MGFSAFEIEKWGPPKLREIHDQIAKEINERSPVAGLGIRISQDPTGRKIETEAKTVQDDGSGGGGGGGSTINLYGSVNGAPAIFHLLQSSAPTVPPPLP